MNKVNNIFSQLRKKAANPTVQIVAIALAIVVGLPAASFALNGVLAHNQSATTASGVSKSLPNSTGHSTSVVDTDESDAVEDDVVVSDDTTSTESTSNTTNTTNTNTGSNNSNSNNGGGNGNNGGSGSGNNGGSNDTDTSTDDSKVYVPPVVTPPVPPVPPTPPTPPTPTFVPDVAAATARQLASTPGSDVFPGGSKCVATNYGTFGNGSIASNTPASEGVVPRVKVWANATNYGFQWYACHS